MAKEIGLLCSSFRYHFKYKISDFNTFYFKITNYLQYSIFLSEKVNIIILYKDLFIFEFIENPSNYLWIIAYIVGENIISILTNCQYCDYTISPH